MSNFRRGIRNIVLSISLVLLGACRWLGTVGGFNSHSEVSAPLKCLDEEAISHLSRDIVQQAESKLPRAVAGIFRPEDTSSQRQWRRAMELAQEALDEAGKTQFCDDKHLNRARRIYAMALGETRLAAVTAPLRYPSHFRLHTGAATTRPYTVEVVAGPDGVPRRALSTSSDTSFYMELDFLSRTAWNKPEEVSEVLLTRDWHRITPTDYEFRLGFINQDRIQSDLAGDSSSQVAGGDWYAEATISWVIRSFNVSLDPMTKDLDTPRSTLNLEFVGGIQTDRQGFSTTGYYQAGIATAWGLPIDLGPQRKLATLAAGIYFGVHEYPRIDDDNIVYSTEAVLPFNRLGSFGIKVDFAVPLTSGIDAIVQARHFSPYGRNDIADDWSLFIGVSLPIGALVRDLVQ